MIRRISLLLLLANTCVVFAQPLYKWLEPDGTITFSPTPPTSGVKYEKLNSVKPMSLPPEVAPVEARTGSQNTPAAAEAPARMQYAPGNTSDLPDAISRRTTGISVQPVVTGVAVNRNTTSAPVDTDVEQSASTNAANYKQSRCQDLKKRVTSLERRLKSRLSPEDMDNTVVHMARYQRSYDQNCSQ